MSNPDILAHPEFGTIRSLHLDVSADGRYQISLNGKIRYDGTDASAALHIFKQCAPRTRFTLRSRASLGLPTY